MLLNFELRISYIRFIKSKIIGCLKFEVANKISTFSIEFFLKKNNPKGMIEAFLDPNQYDLASPDGRITELTSLNEMQSRATILIENISSRFVGFEIEPERLIFNLKSTLAQIGLEGISESIELDRKNRSATVKVLLEAIGPIAKAMLKHLLIGSWVGKLFAADERRRVRDPDYLGRMLGRSDRFGRPLLSLGGLHGSDDLILDKIDGRTVAYIGLQNGRVTYDETIYGFLPTLAKGLVKDLKLRDVVRLHQEWKVNALKTVSQKELLLVRTMPLHVRTVFSMVVDSLLPPGFRHTSARVLQPDTFASGDIYELYGESNREITDIPLEFYTLEPYREHVFFSDRDQLQTCLEDNTTLFKAFATAPAPIENRAAVFIVKGQQLLNLKADDWIVRETRMQEFPGSFHGARQAIMVERYIEQQPSYPFLKSIDVGGITSQGILLTRYFPSPLMKRMLLSDQVQRFLKRIYFQYPSLSHQSYFSAEDRALLHDLDKFAIPAYWVDSVSNQILQFVQKPDRDSGLFVPLNSVEKFLKSTVFGIYGSNLLEGNFESELRRLLEGLLAMRAEMHHPYLYKDVPLSLVTGGGPGAMAVGNRVAKELNILSCANIVDFRAKDGQVVNEQLANPYIEAKMTYRIDKLVERQAEFNLDFPIFLMGGIGTDFEFCLEEVRRKVGSVPPHPIILFGEVEYWRRKITSNFQTNLKTGTIKGSEWISNCFYCVQSGNQALEVYRKFFSNQLPIGKNGPVFEDGFVA